MKQHSAGRGKDSETINHKPEITNYKYQIPNYNIQNSNEIKSQLFGILNFGHCDLFDVCVLLFVIFKLPTAEN
jgi:hypothetical protein